MERAARHPTKVVLTHVIYASNTSGLKEMLAEEARPVLDRQKTALEEQGIKVTVEMLFGQPADNLDDTAEKNDVSAILIGSHGKGILQAATLGSVSGKLIHQTRRPVLLMGIAVLEGEKPGRLQENVHQGPFPYRFYGNRGKGNGLCWKDSRGNRVFRRIAACSETGIDTDPAVVGGTEEDARYLLEAKKERLARLGAAEVTIDLIQGKPDEEIIGRTKEGAFSIIIMGSQAKGLVKEIFLGSVANLLPVMLVCRFSFLHRICRRFSSRYQDRDGL